MSAGAAMFGAMSAVRRSLSLPPAEGLHPERPAQYRPTWLERLGWHRWMTPISRMVWRNMERKRWQMTASVLGIALAIAILVVGFNNLGAVEYLIDLQFRRAQREETKLATILGVEPGDIVRVQVLNGERLQRQVRVHALVDELLGLSAHMELRSLTRMLRQGPTLSGVYLDIDPLLAASCYARLKQLPVVANVFFRHAALEGFRDTMAKSFLIFTLVLVIVASVITFAVIYNAARIALSERGRELASLRMMGFTRLTEELVLKTGQSSWFSALQMHYPRMIRTAYSSTPRDRDILKAGCQHESW